MSLLESCPYLVYKYERLRALLNEARCVLTTSIARSAALWQRHMQTAWTNCLFCDVLCSRCTWPAPCHHSRCAGDGSVFFFRRNKAHNVSVGFQASFVALAEFCATVAHPWDLSRTIRSAHSDLLLTSFCVIGLHLMFR